jgi:hypothetical protein
LRCYLFILLYLLILLCYKQIKLPKIPFAPYCNHPPSPCFGASENQTKLWYWTCLVFQHSAESDSWKEKARKPPASSICERECSAVQDRVFWPLVFFFLGVKRAWESLWGHSIIIFRYCFYLREILFLDLHSSFFFKLIIEPEG